MKKILLLSVIPTLILAACHKDKKPLPDKPEPIVKQYSYWRVNEDSFSTNQVFSKIYSSYGYALAVIRATDTVNNFALSFPYGRAFPLSGHFSLLDTSIQHPDDRSVAISFLYNSKFYFIAYPMDHYLSASSVNGKARYILPPTWFYSYYQPGDSVLISGTFNEP